MVSKYKKTEVYQECTSFFDFVQDVLNKVKMQNIQVFYVIYNKILLTEQMISIKILKDIKRHNFYYEEERYGLFKKSKGIIRTTY